MNQPQLPFSEEMEKALLSSIVQDYTILDSATFRPEMFFIPAHRTIFVHIDGIVALHGAIDWQLFKSSFHLSELSEMGGLQNLSEIWGTVPTAANWRHYYEEVRIHYQRREAHNLLVNLDAKVLDKDYDDWGGQSLQDAIERGLSRIALDQPVPEIPYKKAMIEDWNHVLDRHSGTGLIELSGIRALNLAMGCLLPGEEIVIGAETSFGKTSLAMHFVSHLCFGEQRKKVAVFSMEMRRQAMSERFFASGAEVPLETIRRNELSPAQRAKVEKFINSVPEDHCVFMDDSSVLDIASIISRCRRLRKKYGLDVVVVDYLQLVNPANLKANANRQQEVADISRRLKMLAVELDVVVIALSQLNDAGQLRESRAIGQDADIVMYIRDSEKSEDSFEKLICIEKNRNGPRGKPVPVHFFPQYVSFADKT